MFVYIFLKGKKIWANHSVSDIRFYQCFHEKMPIKLWAFKATSLVTLKSLKLFKILVDYIHHQTTHMEKTSLVS